MKAGTVKTLFVLLLIVPVGAFSQGVPEDVPPEVVLMHVLDLSEEQVAEIERLVEVRAGATEPLVMEVHFLHENLAEVLDGETPDPVVVGEIVLNVRAHEKEIARHQQGYREGFRSMLRPDQMERVGHINRVALALRGAEALGRLGLR